MRTKDPKLAALRSIAMLDELGSRQLRSLAMAVDEIDVAPGLVVIDQGALSRHAYFIVTGAVAIEVDGSRIASVRAGSIVGERAAIAHEAANATVRAIEPTRLLAIDHRVLVATASDSTTLDRVLRDLATERSNEAA